MVVKFCPRIPAVDKRAIQIQYFMLKMHALAILSCLMYVCLELKEDDKFMAYEVYGFSIASHPGPDSNEI